MEENTSLTNPMLPMQMISDGAKTEKWYKENIEAGVSFAQYDREFSLRSSRAEKISNINLVNDKIDPSEIEAAINPYNLKADFPSTYKNYPIVNSLLNLLFGEEIKRHYYPLAYVTNDDILNGRKAEIDKKFEQLIQRQVLNKNFQREQAEAEILKLDKWKKFTYQDKYERTANQMIRYYLHGTDFKQQAHKNFEDLLIQGEEIGAIETYGNKVVFRRVNPLELYTIRVNNSWKIEDSGLIVEQNYRSIPQVIDQFGEFLSQAQIKKLYNTSLRRTNPSALFPNGQVLNEKFTSDTEGVLGILGIDQNTSYANGYYNAYSSNYDDYGNVRVTRVLWKGSRKIGIIKYLDENMVEQKKYVDEHYKVNKDAGEDVTWQWISEWYEGTKIGGDIYIKFGPREVQFRDPDNPSLCHPGLVGNILNIGSSQAKSLVSFLKPYQLQYNFFAHRLRTDFIKYKGHIAKLNISMKPDNWSVDKWMYFVNEYGFMIEDPFNEGQRGAATGILAGGIGYNQGNGIQIGDFNLINANMMILDMLKNEMHDLSGVTPQRKGAIENRETVGGVERSVMQSSNNTEKYFNLHEDFKTRSLKMLVETSLTVWKKSNFKKSFVLDDGTREILDFDGEAMQGLDAIGISINSSSDAQETVNAIKSIAQAYMQNNGTMSEIIDILETKDTSSLKRKLDQYEDQRQQKVEMQRKEEMQMQQQEIQAEDNREESRMQHEIYLKKLDINKELQIKAMEINDSTELDKLKIAEAKLKQEIDLKNKQLNEVIRHNKAQEQQQRQNSHKSKK